MIPKPADYYAHLNTHMQTVINQVQPPVMLDVGCGEGRLGAAVKQQYPWMEVYGVEIAPDAAFLARSAGLDGVVCGNIESLDTIEALPCAKGSVDLITFGDVLEHLVDPGAVLRRLREYLVPRWGQIACIIPNVQHYTVIEDLLRGEWRYTKEGLLDETHLRFFTRRSFERLLTESGYVPTLFQCLQGADPIPPAVRDSLAKLQIDTTDFDVFQYVFMGAQP